MEVGGYNAAGGDKDRDIFRKYSLPWSQKYRCFCLQKNEERKSYRGQERSRPIHESKSCSKAYRACEENNQEGAAHPLGNLLLVDGRKTVVGYSDDERKEETT